MNAIEIEKLKQLVSRIDMSGNDKVRWLTDFIDGRELQLIRDEFYSEEEVIELLTKAHFVEQNIVEWFEQNKKK